MDQELKAILDYTASGDPASKRKEESVLFSMRFQYVQLSSNVCEPLPYTSANSVVA